MIRAANLVAAVVVRRICARTLDSLRVHVKNLIGQFLYVLVHCKELPLKEVHLDREVIGDVRLPCRERSGKSRRRPGRERERSRSNSRRNRVGQIPCASAIGVACANVDEQAREKLGTVVRIVRSRKLPWRGTISNRG